MDQTDAVEGIQQRIDLLRLSNLLLLRPARVMRRFFIDTEYHNNPRDVQACVTVGAKIERIKQDSDFHVAANTRVFPVVRNCLAYLSGNAAGGIFGLVSWQGNSSPGSHKSGLACNLLSELSPK